MVANYHDALASVREQLAYVKPSTESEAFEVAQTGLEEFIDSALTYTSDIMELWDGGTADEISLSDYSELSDAIAASTFFQLRDNWCDAILDGLDGYISQELAGTEHFPDWENGDIDRDEALDIING